MAGGACMAEALAEAGSPTHKYSAPTSRGEEGEILVEVVSWVLRDCACFTD